MNILFLTKEFPYPPDTGYRNRTFHLLKGLSKNNKVHLLCFRNEDFKPNGLSTYCASMEVIQQKKQNRSSCGFICSLLRSEPYSVGSRFNKAMKVRIERLIKSQQFDLFICDSIYQAIHKPTNHMISLLAEHNIESSIMRRYANLENNPLLKLAAWIEHWKMKQYEKKIWKEFDSCFVCSDSDKQELQKKLPNQNVEIIPNGVDLDYYSAANSEIKKGSMVYVGQMNWQPNIDAVSYFLKEMFSQIKSEIPKASFSVIGSNPPDKLKKLAKEKGATITGYVPDIRPFVSQAEIFVVPLRIGGGTRLKILEAMAMGKAIVSTSIGCEGIDVAHEKNILIADTPQDFAKCVVRLLNDKDLRDSLGKAARKLVEEKYSWDIIHKKLDEVISNVATRS